MKNLFKRKVIHIALVNPCDGDEVVTLCGEVRERDTVDGAGKILRVCGTCLDLSLKQYPTEEINDLLGRMHDASHLMNDLIHPLNSVFDLHQALVEVFNRDGIAAEKYKRRD